MKKHDRRRLEIVDIAARLFAENGYDATSITDLGEAVGLGRGALYHYIGSKEDILAEIHNRAVAPLLAAAKVISQLDLHGAGKLRLLSAAFLEVQFELHHHSKVVLKEYNRLSGKQREMYMRSQAEFEEYLAGILEAGKADGTLNLVNPLGAKMAFLNMHVGTARWVDIHGPMSAADWSHAYCSVLLDGISNVRFDLLNRDIPSVDAVFEKIDPADTWRLGPVTRAS